MESTDFDRVITFVNELYGSYLKLKEIHWNTYSKSLHLLIDEINDDLLEYIDDITENILGIMIIGLVMVSYIRIFQIPLILKLYFKS